MHKRLFHGAIAAWLALGAEPTRMSPADFGQWLKAEIPAMAKIVKDEKITVD